jgi:hypothetical protein
MKKLIAAFSVAFLSSSAFAANVTITSNSENPNPKFAALADLPQTLLGLFVDQGLKLANVGGGKFALEVKNIHCDESSNGPVDGAMGGIPTTTCRMNSEDVQFTKKGQRLAEALKLNDVLGKIESGEVGDIFFTDCAMGKCTVFVKSVKCVVDTKIEEFQKGRFSCTLVDGQK